LNELKALDREVAVALFTDGKAEGEFVRDIRMICNDKVANHETIQVRYHEKHKIHTVGFLGLLNGMFGVDEEGFGPMVACVDDDTGDFWFDLRSNVKDGH